MSSDTGGTSENELVEIVFSVLPNGQVEGMYVQVNAPSTSVTNLVPTLLSSALDAAHLLSAILPTEPPEDSAAAGAVISSPWQYRPTLEIACEEFLQSQPWETQLLCVDLVAAHTCTYKGCAWDNGVSTFVASLFLAAIVEQNGDATFNAVYSLCEKAELLRHFMILNMTVPSVEEAFETIEKHIHCQADMSAYCLSHDVRPFQDIKTQILEETDIGQTEAERPGGSRFCTICLTDVRPGMHVDWLVCGHVFHVACDIRTWLNTTRQCPVCRQHIR